MAFAGKAGVRSDSLLGISAESDWLYVNRNQGPLRREFALRNYRYVLNYILLHGRALWVTVLFCLGAVLTQLVVNPLCAYALSRFPMRSTGRLLLFILATMAFPAEVAMIPSFLLLKQMHLLNTYWALILPGAASGFAIFLLKGFFDSLPKELYEAGTMDGASELTMFARVTLPLSKPIFAVIALQGFLAAYGAFMYAFLVCQDQRMWTIMVWLYELQVHNPKFVTMAALTLAALPTLVVFLFAQNVIMRGIILPSEK
jgi:multiple sugar transport system permease protein